MSEIILASASPRRKELMGKAFFDVKVISSKVEEVIRATEPSLIVEELSAQKAWDVYNTCNNSDAIVIGADTVVSLEGKILGKPKDYDDAFKMLRSLSGKVHEVYTGVTIIWMEEEPKAFTFHECTKVHFYEMSDAEIEAYIDTEEPMDKAGAYGIQGLAARFVKCIEGDYNNVVGLPIARVYQEFKAHGLI